MPLHHASNCYINLSISIVSGKAMEQRQLCLLANTKSNINFENLCLRNQVETMAYASEKKTLLLSSLHLVCWRQKAFIAVLFYRISYLP